MIVYFSSVTRNTDRFIEKLGLPAVRIPLKSEDAATMEVDEEFILITPTYGSSSGGSVPKQVIKFLNTIKNRELLRGVIGSGNRNFNEDFARAADTVAAKCKVPLLYRFELAGTEEDLDTVRQGIHTFWEAQKSATPAPSTSTPS